MASFCRCANGHLCNHCRYMANIDKARVMAGLYAGGKTLQQIGDIYGVSRERIRQLLCEIGVGRNDGGQHLRAVEKELKAKRQRTDARDIRTLRVYGCDYSEALALNGGTKLHVTTSIARKYVEQRRNAFSRDIGWSITFPEWVAIYEANGGVENRGRHRYGLVMARYGDTGPYAIGNVYITTLETNSRDWQMHNHGRTPSYIENQVNQ